MATMANAQIEINTAMAARIAELEAQVKQLTAELATLKPPTTRHTYKVHGQKFDTERDVMAHLEVALDCRYILVDWIDVTTNQDAAENRNIWLAGRIRCFDKKDDEFVERPPSEAV